MLRIGFAFAIVLFWTSPTPADPPRAELSGEAKQELKTLEGKWRVVRFVHPDRETTPGTGEDAVVVTFEGGTIDFDGAGKGTVVGLDPATDPKCLDFKITVGSGVLKQDATNESVYELDGDTLTWAIYTGRGLNRPATFDKPTETGGMVLTLSRMKD